MATLIWIVRLAAVLVVVEAAPALAGEWRDYEPAAFAQAQQNGETIFVAVHATWCTTCRAQRPILNTLVDDPALSDAVAFIVNFDTEKHFRRDHQVRHQSTLIVFKGKSETGRSLGDRDQERIRALFTTGF